MDRLAVPPTGNPRSDLIPASKRPGRTAGPPLTTSVTRNSPGNSPTARNARSASPVRAASAPSTKVIVKYAPAPARTAPEGTGLV